MCVHPMDPINYIHPWCSRFIKGLDRISATLINLYHPRLNSLKLVREPGLYRQEIDSVCKTKAKNQTKPISALISYPLYLTYFSQTICNCPWHCTLNNEVHFFNA